MKNQKYKPFIAWGLTAFITIVLSISFFFALFKIGELHAFSQTLSRILEPIIIGALFAYLLSPVYNRLRGWLAPGLAQVMKRERIANKIASGISIAVSIALLVFILYALVAMIVPEVIASVMGIANNYDYYFQTISKWVTNLTEQDTAYSEFIQNLFVNAQTYISNWIEQTLLPNLKDYLLDLSMGVVRAAKLLLNLVIGLIVTIYLLGCKDTLCAQSKKIIYSAFKLPAANLIISKFRYAHHVFGGFISGKLLDSLIIGIICFVGCSILKMPYAMLVSVVVGVTNIIPFFGPFIGAIPSTVLILLNDPLKAVYFVIFVIILQQFDGNILGPKILGDSTGLSSFWVLFAILLFGGLFGFVGMVIGVPTFAVIYSLANDLVVKGLRSKELSVDTNDYRQLDSITEEYREYVELKKQVSLRKRVRQAKKEIEMAEEAEGKEKPE